MYSLLRRLLFLRDAEAVHERVLNLLESAGSNPIGTRLLGLLSGKVRQLPVQTMGLSFRHPIGLAAGFDKNGRVIAAIEALGFSFIEIGTVTPQPQVGNERPRIWRFPEANALVNALGFPGEGAAAVARRLETLREQERIRIPVGVNVGKNAGTPAEQAGDDCLQVIKRFGDLGDYYVVNVSSPNTPGLRDLQSVDRLRRVLEPVQNYLARTAHRPLLVKISPDLADEDVVSIAHLVNDLEMAGMVAANTTTQRERVSATAILDRGGLSGKPLYARTRQVIALASAALQPERCLIAAGGLSSREEMQECLASGAQLVQVYTGFVYGGPRLVRRMLVG